jgi:hypothetical protein
MTEQKQEDRAPITADPGEIRTENLPTTEFRFYSSQLGTNNFIQNRCCIAREQLLTRKTCIHSTPFSERHCTLGVAGTILSGSGGCQELLGYFG